jgi:transcriptional regulator with XRE-family HTH domain
LTSGIDEPGQRLAHTLRDERESRGWSVAELAGRSGVSRAMISRVERAEASPTAGLLGKLSGAFGLTMSHLIARSEDAERSLLRCDEQPIWQDPASGYTRRAISPAAGAPLELVEVELPAGADVSFPASAYAFVRQQIWAIDGTLTLITANTTIELAPGDCLALGAPTPLRFVNDGPDTIRYLVAITRS